MERVPHLRRRAFLGTVASAAIAGFAGLQAQRRRSLRLVLVDASDDAMRRSGELGVAEARRMTELLGIRWTCDTIAAGGPVLASRLASADAAVLLSNVATPLARGAETVPMIAAIPLGAGTPPNLFSVRASAAAKARALKSSPQPGAIATEWHASLFRYGAEQLNARFLAAGITPTADAWCAWLAVKIATESVLRASPHLSGANALSTLAFDAHKGVALSFGLDRYLRQPLYVVSAGKVVTTVAPEEVEE